MAGCLRFDAADWVRFATLAAPLAGASDTAWTVAILVKRATVSNHFHALTYLVGGGTTKAGVSISTGDGLVVDISGAAMTTPHTDTTSPYLLVISKAAGTSTPSVSWKLGVAGAWTDEVFNATQIDTAVADTLELGTFQGGSDLLDGWLGVVGWWEGAMSATQKKELDDNWRTSDWWNCSFGRPVCLIECNVAAASLIDLAGNATGLSVTGTPTLDGAETLDSWQFDGLGTGGITNPDYKTFPKFLLRTT